MSETFLAIDGALNNFGVAVGEYEASPHRILNVSKILHIHTERKKSNIREHDARRSRHIAETLRDLINEYDPAIIFAELPSGSQSAKAAWSLGVTLGIIVSLPRPVIFVTPSEVKKVVRPNADKKEIIAWAANKYPHLSWEEHDKKNWPRWGRYKRGSKYLNEHCADAIAVAHTCIKQLNSDPHFAL